ncbi:Hypothetical Protein FCC1311_075692 [Hondaea fermentalgiana]|uniref:Uncharacterized protein n=1 Tax=Hondaea fermentalgiana TaxID=2315210 RepID=A0A2R5GL29_9STRA|nr:Hypothetical Protein FCC1311_075692 [Hondaea fermentalgiana]|eukprot:GBG31345.1 Hypothetical Protein FCC1311_075692 [Hondaea fermentalgiana]
MQRSLTSDDLKRVYASIVDELVDEYLSGEFIPDLLIDVLTNAKHEYDPVSEDERMAYTMLENVLNKVVSQEIERAVRGVVRVFMDDFLHQQTRRDHDPITANVQRIVDECTAQMTDEVVREALQDMVDAYLFQQQFDVLLDKYLASLVREVVVTALTEVEVEQMCTSMLDDTMDTITREVVTESLQEAETSIKRQRQREDFALVNKMMDRVLNRALARHLLQTIASNGDDVVFREQMQVYMRQKLGDALIRRILMHSTPEERLRQSRISRGALEMITSRALQTTIRANFIETLDEYEAELDRKEANLGS